jgi:hypothetical protein
MCDANRIVLHFFEYSTNNSAAMHEFSTKGDYLMAKSIGLVRDL